MSTPAAWLAEPRSVLPEDAVVDDPDVVSGYSRDMAILAANGRPAAVVFPANTAEVSAVLRIATAHRIPVVPEGPDRDWPAPQTGSTARSRCR